VLWTVGQVGLNAILGIVFVLLVNSNNQAFARVLSIAFVQIVFGLLLIISYIIKAKKLVVAKWWKKALLLHIPLLPHSLSLTVLASADRVMINSIVGAPETAIYSVAYSASMVINLIKISINQAMTPWIYECIKHKDYDSVKKNCNMVILLVMFMAFIFILFAPEVIWIVGSAEYYKAIYVIPPVAASVFFTFLYCIFSTIEFYYEKTKEIMYASVMAAVLNIVLNAIFIRLFGFVAAGYTTLVCYLFLSCAHYVVMKKAVKEHIGDVQLFDLKFILIMGMIVLMSTVIFSVLYYFNIIRYLLILVLFAVAIIKHKDVIGLLKTIKKK
jgi:O-antigen/teichoic acid export membrane protein